MVPAEKKDKEQTIGDLGQHKKIENDHQAGLIEALPGELISFEPG